uniref:Uncharacterized protein n=1 Tax=Salix viminalis TaxID=40686 RepID=A0A6N2L148_SALVM
MAEEAAKAMEPNADLLEWMKRDKCRLLHAVYRPVTLSVAMSGTGRTKKRSRGAKRKCHHNLNYGSMIFISRQALSLLILHSCLHCFKISILSCKTMLPFGIVMASFCYYNLIC